MITLPPFEYSTTFNGIDISGSVLWCRANDVEVALTSPYSGIRAGLHTPCFAMHPQNRNLDSNGAISEKGYRTIASCLLIAYEEANFLYTNKDVLYGRLTQCKAILSESLSRLDALRHEFLPEKMRMKSLLKTHALSQREYMRFIEAHDAEVVSMKETLRGVYRSVYSDFPGRRFPHRVEEQGMAFVIKYFYQASS